MASAFSHAMVAVTVGQAFKSKELRGRELFLGAFCSVIPDLDVIGFSMGIQYGGCVGPSWTDAFVPVCRAVGCEPCGVVV